MGEHRNERGFSLIEVIVAAGLTAFVMIAIASAVAASVHSTTLVDMRTRMHSDALNVLTDLRAITVYDKAMLAQMVGKSASMKIVHSASDIETVDVSVNIEPNVVRYSDGTTTTTVAKVANVTIHELGENISERETLFNEAPAPGSVVGP
jgi:uncharacterized membrane protein YqiK